MASGRVPQTHLSRKRDDAKRQAEMVTIEATGELSGPPLPQGVLPGGESWHPQTVALWAELRRHPLLQDESALLWQFLIDTAMLHHRLWAHGELRHAAEIRLRMAKVAATPEDRQRMKVKIAQHVPEAPEVPAGVSDISTRRKRLTDST